SSPSANTTGKESNRQKSKTRRKNRRVCQQSEAPLGRLSPYTRGNRGYLMLRIGTNEVGNLPSHFSAFVGRDRRRITQGEWQKFVGAGFVDANEEPSVARNAGYDF
ncbi:hypothetical protein, partial [Rhizobium sp. BK008]|uniref:hypothetical protein n=1 Tax=Rhizobium sp. BK008 TaxID=2587094 RepID=UPI001AED3AB9